MVTEIQYRINKLLDDARVDITTSAQAILDIVALSEDTKSQLKTMTIVNNSNGKVYFGTDATVTTSNSGGILRTGEKMELPLMDIQSSPYFIADETLEIAICFWG